LISQCAVYFFVGVEVFCAETVINPMQLYPQDNVNVLPPADEIKFLLTLRLVPVLSTKSEKHASKRASLVA